MSEALSSTATNTSKNGPTGSENGSVFTLTNIYTFGGQNNSNSNPVSDKYHVKSFVEVFDSPSSQQQTEFERNYHESFSSSSLKRQIRTSSTDVNDYIPSNYHHQYKLTDQSLATYGTGSSFLLKINKQKIYII